MLAALLLAAGVAGQTKIKRVPAKSSTSVEGLELYRQYCAVCHGTEGKGGGPAAAAMKATPTDLTRISQQNGGKYPEVRMQRLINGESDSVVAHGSKDMPVWGPIFRQTSANADLGAVKVFALVKYLESIQVK